MCLLHLFPSRETVTTFMQTFQSLDYTTLALAKVWTNRAKLPNSQMMRALYEKSVEERGGYGKYVLFLGPQRYSGKPFLPCLALGLTLRSCHSEHCLSDGLAERGGTQVWWQAGSLYPFSSRSQTDDVDPGRWTAKIVRRSLHVDMGHDSCTQQFQRG